MFTYDVEITFLGKFVDEIRVDAVNALAACEYVESMSKPHFTNEVAQRGHWHAHELVARRVVPVGSTYVNYYGTQVTA